MPRDLSSQRGLLSRAGTLSFQEDQNSAMANFPSKHFDPFVGKAFYPTKRCQVCWLATLTGASLDAWSAESDGSKVRLQVRSSVRGLDPAPAINGN
jgi:hypothetical protein